MKRLLLLFAMVTMAVITNAQPKWGIKGGLNGAGLGGDIENTQMKWSFYAGMLAEFTLSDMWAIQPEALYSRQGAKTEFDGTTTQLRYNYINVPVMAKFSVMENLDIEAGPQIGFALNAQAVADNGEEKIKSELPRENYSDVVFGINVGAAYQLNDGLGINARYNFGVTDIFEGVSKVRDNTFQVGVFIMM